MTTLSLLPNPLKRLFAKIDAAATSDRSLELALDHWRVKRGNRVLPKLSDMDMQQFGPSASKLFLFERCDEDDWALRFAGKDVENLLQPGSTDARLSTLGNRRLAVRLRHLFQLVAQTAEIISASYIAHDQSGEILVAPLSTDGNEVGAVFGGIVTRLGAKPVTKP
ncbi:MAG TPA: PAS domain-containing protein [Methyloceanibacter sp.]|nr:PAS domain-containing protein [Methyloceanibacter sp.]